MGRILVRTVVAMIVVAAVSLGAAVATAGQSCEFLKRSEVERAIDRNVRVGPAPTGVGGECTFRVRGKSADVVNVWVLHGDEAEQGYKNGRELAGDDAKRVRGVGDRAVYMGDPFNTLYAIEDDTIVYLQYYLVFGEESPKKIKRAVVALTKIALARA